MKILLLLLATVFCLGSASPIFNRNYVYNTKSVNGNFSLRCAPVNCTNETDGCITILNKNKSYSSFLVRNISGCTFVISNDGNSVIQVPSYQGFDIFSYDFRKRSDFDRRNSLLKLFYKSTLVDSIEIPSILLTKENERFVLVKDEMAVAKIIKLKGDSMHIITCNGAVLLKFSNKLRILRKNNYLSKGYRELFFESSNRCAYDFHEINSICR